MTNEQLLRDALEEVDGCFNAAIIEGLENAIEETADEHLKDLLVRRLMYAHRAAIEALAAPLPAQPQGQGVEPIAEMVYFVRKGSASEDCLPVLPGTADWQVAKELITRVVPLYAAPPSQAPEPAQQKAAGATQYGWLVENGKQGNELRYRTWRDGFSTWTTSHDEATRYCRRIDAERAHEQDEDAWRIVEHAWDDVPASLPSPAPLQPTVEQMTAWLESDEGKAAMAASQARYKDAMKELNEARKVTASDLSEPYFTKAAPQAAVPSERRSCKHCDATTNIENPEELCPACKDASPVVNDSEIAQWLEEAAEEIEHWGRYANATTQERYGLDDDISKFKERAILARDLSRTAPVVAEWQPIETAPKPSGRVLLAAEGQTCYGHWYSVKERWEYDGYSFGNPKSQPTHWMPLPTSPSAAQGDGT